MAAPMSKENVALLMYIVGFLDLFGVSMVIPLLAKHTRELGASPTTAGLIGSIYGGLQLFSSPIVGKWSDVSGRRRVLLWCLFMSAVGYTLLGLASTLLLLALARIPAGIFKHSQDLSRGLLAQSIPKSQRSSTFGQFNSASSVGFIIGPVIGGHIADRDDGFYVCAVVCACVFLTDLGIFKHTQNIAKAYLADVTPSEFHAKAFGLFNSASSIPFIVGPIIGGHLAESTHGFQLVAGLCVIVILTDMALVWLLVPETSELKKSDDVPVQTSSDDFNPFGFLKSFKEIEWTNLWDLFLVRFFLGFAVLVYRNNFSMMLDYRYDASPKTVGYITSYGAVVSTVSGFFVGRIADFYQNDATMLLHMGVVQVVSIVTLTFAPSLWVLVVCVTPLSLANAVARVASTNLTISRGHGQEIGALMGLGASVLSIARMCSPALGGVAQELHLAGPGILGAVFAAAGVAVMIVVPQDDKTRRDKGYLQNGETVVEKKEN